MEPALEDRTQHLKRAAEGVRETASLEFKGAFDPSSNEAWCELVKDIVAISNSAGGVIVFGIDDHGAPTGSDTSAILHLDAADISNKVGRYVGVAFNEAEPITVERSGGFFPAILIHPAKVPLIFAKPGTYDAGGGKQKTAFGQGTIYFRHGAKSEHGNRDDLMGWLNRELEVIRKEWLSGIKAVVEAPVSLDRATTPVGLQVTPEAIGGRITNDPSGLAVVPLNADELWPLRQKELLAKFNAAQVLDRRLTTHDMLCLARELGLPGEHNDFAYRPHPMASTQYSQGFLDWLTKMAREEPNYFDELRAKFRRGELKKAA